MSKEKDEKINFIKHYQNSIEKSQNEPERVLHCLKKLKSLRIDVQHLKETGIGRTVNSCRKLDGEVAELATALVEKWKALVSESENDVSSRGNSKGSSPDDVKKSQNDSGDDKKSKSHHHHSTSGSSSNKDKGSSKHHKHKSHHSSSSSHNGGERGTKSSSKKRSHTDAIEQDSKENEAKKLKTEAVKNDKSKEQKSSNGHRHSSKKEHKKKDERKQSQEFDVSQGIGFAEALLSFDMPSASSSKHKKENLADKMVKVKSSESSSSKSSKLPTKSSSSSSSKANPKPSTSGEARKSIQTLTQTPKSLTEKPKLDIIPDIVNELPNDVSIPEYRPLPLNSVMKDYINSNVYGSNSMQARQMPQKTESEILAESFSSKANRTRVYSGNTKSRSQAHSLFNMCIRVLQENIDYLECTGGVPFDLLKPVLEIAKPEQLAAIEYYNPYLLEDSDVLWRPHCQRKWKYKKPQEMETWREMYERCTREDEEKLNRLTKHIRHNQEVSSSGIQKTKMAYVDSMVKPPRNVRQKQEQFGTSSKLVASPAARTTGLKHLAPNLTSSGDVRLRVQAGLRDDAQQVVGRGNMNRGGIGPMKKAPMMAKILSKFKR